VAVIGVLAEADVAHDDRLGRGVLDRPHRLLHDPVRCVRLAAVRIFRGRQPEQQHGRDPQARQVTDLAHQLVHRQLEHARHRADLVANAPPVGHEERQDEVARGQRRLANHRAERVGATQAAQS
jgi:hypothetical protein